ncbi:uncharacterized protein LOC129568515 [Sitodiplosis mosellana]|uniref:uncharacterized protein LOC129568515 n=1 Tax=Sitodiplosis mosellana TaxID=263140 RepID=UPI0024446683|nr:uncharacterized protein LOC129568515 [Sitodiplosis mosellana]XP_055302474.1 uncharacterized protein LOC129568515 [Sitodiplosis mosellana]
MSRVLRSKRGRDDEAYEPAKRQKTIDEGEIEVMNINGLINIIGSNKKVNRVACEVYSRKHGDKIVCLSMQEIPVDKSKLSKGPGKSNPIYKVVASFRDDIENHPKALPINIADTIDAERFIRVFGHLVSTLEIDYAENDKTADTRRWKAIERLVMEHCSDSLVHLILEYNGGDAFNKLRKPFPKLKRLCLKNCILTSKIALTMSNFPNVHQLVVDRRGFGDHQHFLNSSTASPQLIKMAKKIGTFVLPNIKMANLVNDYGGQKYLIIEFLQTVNKNMPQLTQMELYDLEFSTSIGTRIVHFENVTDLVICQHESAPLRNIPLSFAKLKDLELFGFASSKAAVLSFVTGAEHLSKLNFNPDRKYGNIDDELKEIADKLKNLEEIIITEYVDTFSVEALKLLILNCSALRKVRIRFYYGIIPRRNAVAKEISEALPDWKVATSTKCLKTYGFRTDLNIERSAF